MVEENKEKRAFLLNMSTDAQSFIYQGKKDEALQCFDKILEKYPEEIPAIYGKGMTYFEFDELEQAIDQFDIALEIDPNEVDSLYAKGAILSSIGKNQEALTLLEKTIELEPKLHIAWLAKGYIFLDEKKYEEAIICFSKVEELGQKETVYVGKGHALRKLDKFEEAVTNYKLAISIDPYDAEALLGLGAIEYRNKNLKKALDYLYKSVVQDEEIIEAWETLAEVYKLLKKPDKEKIARDKLKTLKEK
ncbi:MAG: tetratricopeptide repeat protein [Candidatus Heimdallarchaeota archaeon]